MNNEVTNKANEILTQYGLDFTIEKQQLVGLRPVTVVGEGGELEQAIQQIATPYFGLYNDKTKEMINTVKKGYTVSQNAELVELVLEGMKGFGELSVSKAGSLNGGRKVFIQLGIEGMSKVGSDNIKRYVTIIDSNDGSTGLSVGIGDLTMSCSNQFYQFNRSGDAKWRHSASLIEKLKTLPSLISNALADSLRMIEVYKAFESTPCSRNLANDLVNHITGIDKTMDLSEKSTKAVNAMNELYLAIETEMNQKGDNVWGLHSGVTRWTTHTKMAPNREHGRFESSATSTNYKTNQKSLAFAMELAQVEM